MLYRPIGGNPNRMKEKLSMGQRIHNAMGSQAVENVKAWHTYLHAKAHSTEEWSTYWSKSDDCSWAHAFGRMRGFEHVWRGSVTDYDARCCRTYLSLYQIHPEVGGKDIRPLMECAIHTLLTDVIEVAEDGKTARSSFITPGINPNLLHPDQERRGGFLWERYGSDFICEDGQWKYLHEQVCPDVSGELDYGNWAHDEYLKLLEGAPGRTPSLPSIIDDIGPLHFNYSPIQTVQDTVPWPEPYKTMDDDNTYTKKDKGQ